jgi:hypothetical protein
LGDVLLGATGFESLPDLPVLTGFVLAGFILAGFAGFAGFTDFAGFAGVRALGGLLAAGRFGWGFFAVFFVVPPDGWLRRFVGMGCSR